MMAPLLIGLALGVVFGGVAIVLVRQYRRSGTGMEPNPKSVNRMESILYAAPEAMVVADASGTIRFINHMAEQAFGYSADDLVGKPMETLIPEEYRGKHHQHFAAFTRNADLVHHMLGRPDITGLRQDGTTFPAAASVAKLDHGGEALFVAVMRDVSAQRRLESRQRQLSSAIDTISEAVSVYDADDRFVFGNKSFLELNSLIADLLVPGAQIEDLLRAIVERGGAPDAVGREEDWLAERMTRHRDQVGPFEIHRQGGWVLVTQQKMEDGGTVLLSADITPYKEAELQRRNALEEMHKANLAKSRFLANISHELRTPLNAILGFSEILGREQFGPLGHEKYQEYAADIVTSSHHLLMLVNDLLDISTIEAGEKTLHRENIDTAGIIDECLHIVGNAAGEKNITLDIHIPEGQGVVYADQRAVKQIVLNLLSNAVKFTPDDGRVSVTVANGTDDCVIAVKDTGIGIPNDRIPDLTDPFVRVEDGQYTAQEGTGLGLAIVDSLVKLHEGALNIDSEVGKGTTVTVSFPM